MTMTTTSMMMMMMMALINMDFIVQPFHMQFGFDSALNIACECANVKGREGYP